MWLKEYLLLLKFNPPKYYGMSPWDLLFLNKKQLIDECNKINKIVHFMNNIPFPRVQSLRLWGFALLNKAVGNAIGD